MRRAAGLLAAVHFGHDPPDRASVLHHRSSGHTCIITLPGTLALLQGEAWLRMLGNVAGSARFTPAWPATSTQFISVAPRRLQPILTNMPTNCSMHTSLSKMRTRF